VNVINFFFNFRRFGTPTGLTDDDKEQRQIYKKVLEFEQESVSPIDVQKRQIQYNFCRSIIY
jgi:hypothetical protein